MRSRSLAVAIAVSVASPYWVASTCPAAHALQWPFGEEALFSKLESSTDTSARLQALRSLSVQRAHVERAVHIALEDEAVEVRAEGFRIAATHNLTSAEANALDATRATEAILRNRACGVLGLAKTKTHLSALVRLAGDADAEVRIAALTALAAWSDDDEASASIASHVDDATPNVRARAVALLAEHRGSRALGAIAGKLQDSSVDVRLTVARALGDLGDKRAASTLILGLRDSSSDVVRESARSLGALRAEIASSALIALLPSRQPATLRAALLALGRIGTKEAIDALIGELVRGNGDRARLEETPLRRALLSAGDKSRKSLENVLKSGTFWPSTSAAWILARQADTNGELLAEALRRGRIDAEVALDGLSRIGGESALLSGLAALRDGNPSVRFVARAATSAGLRPDVAVHAGDGRAVEPILAAIRVSTSSPAELASLLRLLGMTRAVRAIGTLHAFLASDDETIAIAAIEGLSQMNDPKAAEILASKLLHRSADVRLAAASALRRGAAAIDAKHIVNLLNHEPAIDRTLALSALSGPVMRGAAPPSAGDALVHARGPERAAWLELAVLSAPGEIEARLQTDARSDRRTMTQIPWPKTSAMQGLARKLMTDSDPAVRAHTAWQLGELGDATDLARLAQLAKEDDPAAAANAVASYARVASSLGDPEKAAAATNLCGWAESAFPYAKANALAGLGLLGARCAHARPAFAKSQPLWLQLAAANALGTEGCAELREREETSCSPTPPKRLTRSVALVFVYGPRRNAQTNFPFSVQFRNGFIRSGWTDARGAFLQPEAEGETLKLLQSAASGVIAE